MKLYIGKKYNLVVTFDLSRPEKIYPYREGDISHEEAKKRCGSAINDRIEEMGIGWFTELSIAPDEEQIGVYFESAVSFAVLYDFIKAVPLADNEIGVSGIKKIDI